MMLRELLKDVSQRLFNLVHQHLEFFFLEEV